MNIKRKPLEFHNVVKRNVSEKGYDLMELAEVRMNLMQKDVFINGPLIIEGKWGEGPVNILVPTSAEIEFVEHTEFSFEKDFRCDDGIYYRNGADEFNEQAMNVFMHKVAEDLGVELEENYYCVVLNVYGGKLYDVYAPIKK